MYACMYGRTVSGSGGDGAELGAELLEAEIACIRDTDSNRKQVQLVQRL